MFKMMARELPGMDSGNGPKEGPVQPRVVWKVPVLASSLKIKPNRTLQGLIGFQTQYDGVKVRVTEWLEFHKKVLCSLPRVASSLLGIRGLV